MQKEFITLDLSSIIPYENNPRINEDAVPDVEESMRQCGNIDPIEVDENNVILSGHTRLMALQQLGETETEVLRVTGLSDEQKKKYRILANKAAERAQWDFDRLKVELDSIDFEGYDFGFLDFNADIDIEPEQKGSLAGKFLVPPFSVIYGNKGEWLARKRKWVQFGIHSEVGRGGQLAYNTRSNPEANFLQSRGGTAERSKAFKNNSRLNSYMTSRKRWQQTPSQG